MSSFVCRSVMGTDIKARHAQRRLLADEYNRWVSARACPLSVAVSQRSGLTTMAAGSVPRTYSGTHGALDNTCRTEAHRLHRGQIGAWRSLPHKMPQSEGHISSPSLPVIGIAAWARWGECAGVARCAGAQGLSGRPMAGMSVSPRASQVPGKQKTGGNRICCNSRPVGLREMWLLGPLLGESSATLAGGFREQHLAQADHLGSDLDVLILFDVLECLLERHLAGRLQEDRVIG